MAERIRERSGCTVVGVERDGEILTDLTGEFALKGGDGLYVFGTAESLQYVQQHFAMTRL